VFKFGSEFHVRNSVSSGPRSPGAHDRGRFIVGSFSRWRERRLRSVAASALRHGAEARDAAADARAFDVHAVRVPTSARVAADEFPEASEIFVVARDQHLRIIEAIANRQGGRAESIARAHAQITRRALQFALAHAQGLGALPGGSLIQV